MDNFLVAKISLFPKNKGVAIDHYFFKLISKIVNYNTIWYMVQFSRLFTHVKSGTRECVHCTIITNQRQIPSLAKPQAKPFKTKHCITFLIMGVM